MKMIYEILFFLLAIILLAVLFFGFADPLFSPSFPTGLAGTVCYENNCFNVEIAKTAAQIERGLMYRNQLPNDEGMLFIFNKQGVYPFWMKNTLIPLDIIWINSENKVVSITSNAQPCKSLMCPSIMPSGTAKYVLELNGGTCEKIGLSIGDLLQININQ